jgi:hypothetical protein
VKDPGLRVDLVSPDRGGEVLDGMKCLFLARLELDEIHGDSDLQGLDGEAGEVTRRNQTSETRRAVVCSDPAGESDAKSMHLREVARASRAASSDATVVSGKVTPSRNAKETAPGQRFFACVNRGTPPILSGNASVQRIELGLAECVAHWQPVDRAW